MNWPCYYEGGGGYETLRTKEGRVAARRWLAGLEQSRGLYNADETHVCAIVCLGSATLTDSERAARRADLVQTIDADRHIYGCPRSGRIHQCGVDAPARQQTCTLTETNEIASVHCLFSGQTLREPELLYNPFTEQSIVVAGSTAQWYRPKRARRSPGDPSAAQARTPPAVVDMRATTKKLGDMALRRKASPKRKREEEDALDVFNDSPPPQAKVRATVSHITASRRMDLNNGYSIGLEARGRIERTIDDVLFDPLVHANMGGDEKYRHVPPCLGDKNDRANDTLRLFYGNRVSIIYAVALAYLVAPTKPARRRTNVRRGIGRKPVAPAPHTLLQAKRTTLAILDMLTVGLPGVLPPDTRLKVSLPAHPDLMWYGLNATLRCSLLSSDMSPTSQHIRYASHRDTARRLKTSMNAFPHGPEALRRIIMGA